jgi:hypothetical protein
MEWIKVTIDECDRDTWGVPIKGSYDRITCKLPEDGQEILITVGHGEGKAPTVELDIYHEDEVEGNWTENGHIFGSDIIAWMPAPSPYRLSKENCAVCVETGTKWCADCTENGGRYNYFKAR